MPCCIACSYAQPCTPNPLQGFPVNFEEGTAAIPLRNDDDTEREELRSTLAEIGGNMRASSHYLSLARDLDVMEAKLPNEVTPCSLQCSRQCSCHQALWCTCILQALGCGGWQLNLPWSIAPVQQAAVDGVLFLTAGL